MNRQRTPSTAPNAEFPPTLFPPTLTTPAPNVLPTPNPGFPATLATSAADPQANFPNSLFPNTIPVANEGLNGSVCAMTGENINTMIQQLQADNNSILGTNTSTSLQLRTPFKRLRGRWVRRRNRSRPLPLPSKAATPRPSQPRPVPQQLSSDTGQLLVLMAATMQSAASLGPKANNGTLTQADVTNALAGFQAATGDTPFDAK